MKIHIQLDETESAEVARDMVGLADVLDHFNDVDDDEILRLYEQAIAVFCRVEGSSSYNVANGENNLGAAYQNRANRAEAANDLERCMANSELVLSHGREAARIFRAINHMDNANQTLQNIAQTEKSIRKVGILLAKAAAAAAATRG